MIRIPKVNPPKIDIHVMKVQARTRQIGATWTIEIPQDIEYHIDKSVEDDLAAMIAKEFENRK